MPAPWHDLPGGTCSSYMAAAIVTAPRFARFLEDEPDNAEGGDGVDPPCRQQQVRNETHDDDEREPAARQAFNRVRTHRSAPELASHVQLSPCEDRHDRHREGGDDEAWDGELPA